MSDFVLLSNKLVVLKLSLQHEEIVHVVSRRGVKIPKTS